jgi:curved DNA-binding protein
MYDDVKSGRFRGAYAGFDPSKYRTHTDGSGGYTYTWTSDGGDASGFSDFFNMFFGGKSRIYDDFFGAGGYDFYNEDGQDINAKVEIGIRQAYKGGQQTVSLQTEDGTKTVKFKIPAGIGNGEKIKLSGLGGKASGKGKAGDLYLEIVLKPEAGFSLNGTDLEKTVDIYPWQAALGDEILVNTLDEKLNVKIPAGIQTGGKLRISARGYPTKNGKRGSLSLTVRIVNPPVITEEMKSLYKQMAQLMQKSGQG